MELSVLLGRFGNRSISRIISELGSIWTSVAFALALAAAAACVGLLRRLRILALRRRSRIYKRGISSSSPSPHAVTPRPSSSYFSDADDVDDSSCCSSDDDEEDDDEEEECDSDSEDGDDRGQDGELVVGRSASWTREEVGWSGAVVKTWEGMGLGLGLGLGSERPAGKRMLLSSLFDLSCGGGEISTAAEEREGEGEGEREGAAAAVRVWKAMAARQGRQAAEAAAAGHYIPWPALPRTTTSRSRRRRASVGSLLIDGRSAWEETRWDAGAGRDAEEGEEKDPYAGVGRSGSSVVVTWCRNAVNRLPLLPSPNARLPALPFRVPSTCVPKIDSSSILHKN